MPTILQCIVHPYNNVRHMAARVVGTLSILFSSNVMEILLEKVIPLLNDGENVGGREGAIETIYCILLFTCEAEIIL